MAEELSIKEQIIQYQLEITNTNFTSEDDLEQFRLRFLSKKGILGVLFDQFKGSDPAERKETGKVLNELKQLAESTYTDQKTLLAPVQAEASALLDRTLPGYVQAQGSRHPISIMRNKIVEIFSRIGFAIVEGPEIEDDWHNFTALNFPPEHPARDMQDTFFIEKDATAEGNDIALRTHTSSVQIRLMENGKAPFRVIMPGRVFRNEAVSARANCFFHQVEGLYVDKGVSFADLKQTLYYFVQEMFGAGTEIRFRPSYFPFTEPSAELDISCTNCAGKGCTICKYSGWVEILGCGMVDPDVLKNCGIDPEEYSGFAFGMGIDRMALNKYKTGDIRIFFENDQRFLRQFSTVI